MEISWRNQDLARLRRTSPACFFHVKLTSGIKPLRQQSREERRHVLHHQYRQRIIGRQVVLQAEDRQFGPVVDGINDTQENSTRS
jgi:hypothetical protein